MRAQAGAIAADTRGASIIELAIVAPVLGVMLVGVVELSRGWSERYFLQQAVNRTLELAQVGTMGSDYTYIIPEAADAARVPASNVTLDQWLECDTTRKAYTSSCDPGQRVSRYIKLSISSSFKPLFGTAIFADVQADGSFLIKANGSLRVQ